MYIAVLNFGVIIATTPKLRETLISFKTEKKFAEFSSQETKVVLKAILLKAKELGFDLCYAFEDFLETGKLPFDTMKLARKHFQVVG